MKRLRKLLAGLLAVAMLAATAAPALAKTDKSNLQFRDVVDSDGENAYYDHGDTVKPGDKYYIILGKSTGTKLDNLLNKKLFSFSLKKRGGGKYITGTDIVEKRFGNTRYIAIEFDAKDNFTADENKVELEAIFTAKQDLWIQNIGKVDSGTEFPIFVTTQPVSPATRASIDYDTALTNAKKALSDAEAEFKTVKAEVERLAKILNVSSVDGEYPIQSVDNIDTLKREYDEKKAELDRLDAAVKALEPQVKALEDELAARKDEQPQPGEQEIKTEQIKIIKKHLTDLGINPESYTSTPDAGALPFSMGTSGLVVEFNKTQKSSVDAATNAEGAPIEGSLSWADWNAKLTAYLANPDYNADAISQLDVNALDKVAEHQRVAEQINALAAQLFANIETLKATPAPTTFESKRPLAEVQAEYNQKKAALDTATSNRNTLSADVSNLKQQLDTATANATNVTAYNKAAARYNVLNGTQSGSIKALQNAVKTAQDNWDAYEKKLRDQGADKLEKGDKYAVDFTIWIQNEKQEDDDANFTAGEKGVVIRPIKNEENTITWENSSRVLARLIFTADSDTDYICPRLTTRWNNADYLDYFDGQDAFLLDFEGNPDIPATTRGRLELNNPFIDDDGDYYHRARDLYLYEVVNGKLREVSDYTPTTNDDGDQVLMLRTRTLGTYIICEEPVDLDDEDDTPTEKPSDTKKPSIIINANNKPVPNTGR